jgi:hypothetical protein
VAETPPSTASSEEIAKAKEAQAELERLSALVENGEATAEEKEGTVYFTTSNSVVTGINCTCGASCGGPCGSCHWSGAGSCLGKCTKAGWCHAEVIIDDPQVRMPPP